eukprot:1043612-Amorphochlora_amoeboformis.AAC.1
MRAKIMGIDVGLGFDEKQNLRVNHLETLPCRFIDLLFRARRIALHKAPNGRPCPVVSLLSNMLINCAIAIICSMQAFRY